jgi:hypothetical protein
MSECCLSIKIQVTATFDRVQAYLKGAPEREAEVQRLWKEQGSQETINFMRVVMPVKTGLLRDSIITKVTSNGISIFPTASYSGFVDRGTKPHAIYPSEAQVLRWYSPSGDSVFSKYVNHPGTRGVHFIQQTADAMREVLRQLYIMIWREQN